MGKIKSILFVCTGNSCRSVMAEALMVKHLRALGKNDIIVSSAGTRALDGYPPTPETVEVINTEGVDVVGFRSSPLTNEAIKGADLILVMEAMHKLDVISRVPQAASKTFLLKEYGRTGKEETGDIQVPDPIGRPLPEYKTCLDTIKKEIERVAKLL